MARPRVFVVTPALAEANNGNAHTASRWGSFLAPIADVEIATAWNGEPCDAMIALHARRSAESIARFAASRSGAPLAVVLTGTDLYGDLAKGDRSARHSIECARIVIVLQEAAVATLRQMRPVGVAWAAKARVVVQSAPSLRLSHRDGDADFAAVGHLRDVKDPLTLMRAARRLAATEPDATVAHIGDALDPALAAEARRTTAECPQYRWHGALPHAAARRVIARSRALVHPSRMEGGANVVIEAIRSGVPVLASRIDGNLGLLGGGYDGTFAAGDEAALASLMRRFRRDADFASHLTRQCKEREAMFRPGCERRDVRALVRELLSGSAS